MAVTPGKSEDSAFALSGIDIRLTDPHVRSVCIFDRLGTSIDTLGSQDKREEETGNVECPEIRHVPDDQLPSLHTLAFTHAIAKMTKR